MHACTLLAFFVLATVLLFIIYVVCITVEAAKLTNEAFRRLDSRHLASLACMSRGMGACVSRVDALSLKRDPRSNQTSFLTHLAQ